MPSSPAARARITVVGPGLVGAITGACLACREQVIDRVGLDLPHDLGLERNAGIGW